MVKMIKSASWMLFKIVQNINQKVKSIIYLNFLLKNVQGTIKNIRHISNYWIVTDSSIETLRICEENFKKENKLLVKNARKIKA